MQRIINAHYNQRLLSLRDLKPNMRPVHVWRSWTPASVRRAHFFYCNHNIHGSGLKWKNLWRWLYDALIIHCVARIVAVPCKRLRPSDFNTESHYMYCVQGITNGNTWKAKSTINFMKFRLGNLVVFVKIWVQRMFRELIICQNLVDIILIVVWSKPSNKNLNIICINHRRLHASWYY
jgi:hypothetical protein